MSQPTVPRSTSLALEQLEDHGSNPSTGRSIGDLVAERLSRRDLGRGLLAVLAVDAVMPDLLATSAAATEARAAVSAFSFEEIAAGSDATHHVAP